MLFDITVSGIRETEVRLQRFTPALAADLEARFERLVRRVEMAVEGSVPTGKTGRLLAQVRSAVDVTPNRIRARVFVDGGGVSQNYRKAAALEYGARRETRVKEHTRIASRAFGRAVSPFQQIVDRYERTPRIRAYRFLRNHADELRSGGLDAVRDAVVAAGGR